MFRPAPLILSLAATLGCDLLLVESGYDLIKVTLTACVEWDPPLPHQEYCESPARFTDPTSVSVRITGSRGHDSVASFDSDNLAVFHLAPPDRYELEIVHQDVVLDCFDTELRVTPEDDESVRRIACPPLPHRQAPEMVVLATAGHFDIEMDTLRVARGQLFDFFRRFRPDDHLPDIPGKLYVGEMRRGPEVLRCLTGDWYRAEWRAWRFPPTCPDSPDWFPVTEEIRAKLVHIVPCTARVPLSEDPASGSGISVGITDCVQASLVSTELGAGIEQVLGTPLTRGLRAVGCGSTWVSRTRRDTSGRQWPAPFASHDRMEVEITC